MNTVTIYDVARIMLVFAGAGGLGWAIVTSQPPATFAGILSGVAALMAYLTSEQTKALADKVEVIHAATNSMKDALVKSTGEASFAEGREAGRAEEK